MEETVRKLTAAVLTACMVLPLAACSSGKDYSAAADEAESTIFTMGTVFSIRLLGDDADSMLKSTESVLYDENDLISWREDGSVISDFNSSHTADISQISDLIEMAQQVNEDSEGAFDITVLPLTKVWGFDKIGDADFDINSLTVPDQADIDSALAHVGMDKLQIDPDAGTMSAQDPDVQVELGAIGKGYAIQKAMDSIRQSDLSGALISAGSSIAVYGTKQDGTYFNIGLRDPRGEEDNTIAMLSVTDCSISSSGDYEHYFEQDGKRYHHIIDPETGYPADSGLMQTTIICDDGALADALSTACMVLGLDKGMALANKYKVGAIFIDTDKNVWYNSNDVLGSMDFSGEDQGYKLCEYN